MGRIWSNGSGLPLNAANLNSLEGDVSAAKTIRWTPSTFYPAGTAILSPSGDVVTAKADHTSGSSFTAANWSRNSMNKGDLFFNVKDYGAKGDGSTDDTAAIQATINAAASEAINTSVGGRCSVIVPGAHYNLTSTILHPPYVKVACAGTAIMESHTTGASAWRVAPLATDPTTLYSNLGKQQWLRGNVLDGSAGGILFINRNATTGTDIGLEVGSQSDLGGSRPMARYSMADVAIQGYNAGMKWNAYNHYIGSYTRFHIETNDTAVQIGSGVAQVNSGENFSFHSSIIAGAMVGFDFNTDSFDIDLVSTSLDFLGTAFSFRAVGGWGRVLVSGGHIEGINEGARNTANGGIAYSAVVSPNVFPDVQIAGQVPFKLNERHSAFKGNMRLRLGMAYRTQDWTNMNYADNVLCDDLVTVKSCDMSTSNGSGLISRGLNRILDPVVGAEADGTAGSALTHWTVTTSNCALTVNPDGPRTSGSKSMQAVITGSGNFTATPKEYIPVAAGDTVRVGMFYKYSGTPYPSASVVGKFYDVNKVLIQTTSSQSYGRTNTTTGAWRAFDGSAKFVAPTGACYFLPTFTVGTGSGDGVQTYQFSEFYVTNT